MGNERCKHTEKAEWDENDEAYEGVVEKEKDVKKKKKRERDDR
jgi:hypothetical protein